MSGEAFASLLWTLASLEYDFMAHAVEWIPYFLAEKDEGSLTQAFATYVMVFWGATAVAAAIHLTCRFAPSRWNTSSNPARDTEIRPIYGSFGMEEWDVDGPSPIFLLSLLLKTGAGPRFALRMLGSATLHFHDG